MGGENPKKRSKSCPIRILRQQKANYEQNGRRGAPSYPAPLVHEFGELTTRYTVTKIPFRA